MTIHEMIDATSALLEETNKNQPLTCDRPDICRVATRTRQFHFGFPLCRAAERLCPACRANFLISVARNAMIEISNRR